jgi:hypothetical protein
MPGGMCDVDCQKPKTKKVIIVCLYKNYGLAPVTNFVTLFSESSSDSSNVVLSIIIHQGIHSMDLRIPNDVNAISIRSNTEKRSSHPQNMVSSLYLVINVCFCTQPQAVFA